MKTIVLENNVTIINTTNVEKEKEKIKKINNFEIYLKAKIAVLINAVKVQKCCKF